MTDQPIPLRILMGARLRDWRMNKGFRQEHVALAARRLGVSWYGSTIAQLERGSRHLTAEEFIMLPAVWTEATGGKELYTCVHLLPEKPLWQSVAITPKASSNLDAVRHLLEGNGQMEEGLRAKFSTPHSRQMAAWVKVAAGQGQASARSMPRDDAVFSEADRKAARKLGCSPRAIAAAAWKRWQRSLTDERERLLALLGGNLLGDPRRQQALRGVITRRLLDQLQPMLRQPKSRKRNPTQ